MRIFVFISLAFLTFFAQTIQVVQAEILGEITLNDIGISSVSTYNDEKKFSSSLAHTSFGVKWKKTNKLLVQLRVGNTYLQNTPSFFQQPNSSFGFYEAYGEVSGSYGRARAGLVPLEFGYEGQTLEHNNHLFRTLIFKKRLVGLRDFGLSYSITHPYGFFTRLAIHNGEGLGKNKDNKSYYTATWGWKDDKTTLGVSGQSGETSPASTEGSNPIISEFNPSYRGSISMGQTFFNRKFFNSLDFTTEFLLGSVEQKLPGIDDGGASSSFVEKKTSFNAGQIDLVYHRENYPWMVLARYDFLKTNKALSSSLIEETTIGLGFTSLHLNSVIYFLYSREKSVANGVSNQFSFVWKLRPQLP